VAVVTHVGKASTVEDFVVDHRFDLHLSFLSKKIFDVEGKLDIGGIHFSMLEQRRFEIDGP
jgi:hypothetical protein